MTRKRFTFFLIAVTSISLVCSASDARQARRRERQQQQLTELNTAGLSADALRKLYLGAWNDQGGRFWFSIDRIDGMQVKSASFRMAHLQNGRIDGNRLTLLSGSCVPVIGCYGYTIKGTVMADSRMDIRGTDDSGETVHFVLVRKPRA